MESKKEKALPDVYSDWSELKNRPIVNKNQPFEWMNHLTNDEIYEWESKIKGDPLTAMIDTHILYELSKLK